MYDFTGQLALVTGGTRGIGAAVTYAFLAAGARVVAVYAASDEAARAFADALPPDQAARLALARFDVADAGAVESFFDNFHENVRFGDAGEGGADDGVPAGPSILVNNAGIRRDAALALMPEADWQRVLDVNLTGAYHVCKFGVRAMSRARYGRIVNITSPSGRIGFEGQSNYSAAKAGLVAMTASLAKEVARRGVTANCVSPGFIDTDLIADLPPEQAAEYRARVPLKRFGTPADVAHAVLFLAAKESGYITGATLEVTGGL